jgi:hypothetical protein
LFNVMAKPASRPRRNSIHISDEDIRHYSDFQLPWRSRIEPLHQSRFLPENRSIHGDAPKSFIRVHTYTPGKTCHRDRPSTWPAFIAKLGSKWYPVESITEHLVTRLGQVCGINIADSQLRIVGRQVRFLSRYFLDDRRQRLTHGLDLFRFLLDDDMVEQIADQRREREVYTFQTVRCALELMFEADAPHLMRDLVTLLGFDAFVGNNDRHPMNWGVIVPIEREGSVRFAPVYDSARALFWNVSEKKIEAMLAQPSQLAGYINRSQPQIGWDKWQGADDEKFDHFTLMRLIATYFPHHRNEMRRFLASDLVARCEAAIEREFSPLLSNARRRLIVQCLHRRQERLAQALR